MYETFLGYPMATWKRAQDLLEEQTNERDPLLAVQRLLGVMEALRAQARTVPVLKPRSLGHSTMAVERLHVGPVVAQQPHQPKPDGIT